jgi:hypothetical protein
MESCEVLLCVCIGWYFEKKFGALKWERNWIYPGIEGLLVDFEKKLMVLYVATTWAKANNFT